MVIRACCISIWRLWSSDFLFNSMSCFIICLCSLRVLTSCRRILLCHLWVLISCFVTLLCALRDLISCFESPFWRLLLLSCPFRIFLCILLVLAWCFAICCSKPFCFSSDTLVLLSMKDPL